MFSLAVYTTERISTDKVTVASGLRDHTLDETFSSGNLTTMGLHFSGNDLTFALVTDSHDAATGAHHLDEHFVNGTLDHLTESTQREGEGSSWQVSHFVSDQDDIHIESTQQSGQATVLYPSATARVYDVHAAYGSAAAQGLTVFSGYTRRTTKGYQSLDTIDTPSSSQVNTEKTYEEILVSSAGDSSVHQTRSYGTQSSRTTTTHSSYGYGDSSYTENYSFEEGPLSYDYQVGPDQIVNLLMTPLSDNFREVYSNARVPARRWVDLVNEPQTDAELQSLRKSVLRGQPYGSASWIEQTTQELGLESTLRPRGRPRNSSLNNR